MLNTISNIALALSLGGNIFINYKKRIGYIIWIVGNFAWITVNFVSGFPNYQQIAMYLVYSVLNIHGFIKWGKANRDTNKDEK